MTAQKSLDADVYRIFDERPNACPPPKRCTSFGFDAALIQILRYPVCPVSVIGQQIEDFLDNLGFIFIDHQIPYRLILFVGTALMLQFITIRKVPAPVLAFLYHLTMLGLNADRSLFTFAGCLPEADVVQQFVHMVIKPLLTFAGTPHLDALLNKPLNHERRFIVASAQAVKHENQQDIELMKYY